MKKFLWLIFFTSNIIGIHAQAIKKHERLAHTFSIVARDEKTGEMAVGVQSHYFNVGTAVPWGEAGVGVVATQAFVNRSFGPRGLELMKQGKSPQEALDILIQADTGREVRQVALLDTFGRVATHTGKNCIVFAGQKNGPNFSVQANMMLNDKVIPAMELAWKNNAFQPLAERVVEVMKAAQVAGGDIRGQQSAALLVVNPRSTGKSWQDRVMDLRVEDNKQPIKELERLVKISRAYDHMDKGDLLMEKNDMKGAMEEYNASMRLNPSNFEMQYWTAITLANNKHVDKAVELLQKIYVKDPNWRELTKRLPKCGLLTVTPAEFQKLVK
ncbi:MAG: hypothetical protein JWN78_2376 [Bacteroidota bacterium]|nr:hypothetical protein [Bacteroidota bacterium]